MTQTARNLPRYALEAAIEFVSPAGTTRGRTKDVSSSGLAVGVERPLPTGLTVNVRMSLVFDEDTFSEPLVLPGRVLWCTPLGDQFQLGTSFLPMDAEQQSYLAMFLRYLREGTEAQAKEQEPPVDEDENPFV